MGGLTKYELECLEKCGCPNYVTYIETFTKRLDEELGYHIDVEIKEFFTGKGKFKQEVVNHRIRLEGMSKEEIFKGRDTWDFFKDGWSFKHAIEDNIYFWFPDTREEYLKAVAERNEGK